MKKRVVATSLMSIAMLAGIATGATYALFTASDTVNVAVNAGKVSVDAFVKRDSLTTFSMGSETEVQGTFDNGGTAVIKDNGDLDLNLLTPGDRALFTVQIDNNSNVNIKYRVVLSIEGELADGLVTKVLFNNREYPLAGGKTGWMSLEAGKDIPDVTIDIELPVEAGNEYQETTASISVSVEAIQGNAETVDAWSGRRDTTWHNETTNEYVIYSAEELAGFAALVNGENGNEDTFAGKTVKLGDNIDLKGINWTAIGEPSSDTYVGFAGTFDGNGYTISNLKIDNPSAWGQGLFGYNDFKSTVIKNLSVNNVTVKAEDTSGAVGGYFQFGTFENVAVTGDIAITGAQHMGGIVGNGYYVDFDECSVIGNDGSYITATTNSFVGGIVGYHSTNTSNTNAIVKNLSLTALGGVGGISGIEGAGSVIDGALVENVTLTKTGVNNLPSVGLASGSWDAKSNNPITYSNNTFKNITLNGKYTEVAEYEFDEIFGTPYGGGLINDAVVVTNNIKENIVNNLEKIVPTIVVSTVQEFLDAASSITGETVIDGSAANLVVNLDEVGNININAGAIVKGINFTTSSTKYIMIGAVNSSDIVTFENCLLRAESTSQIIVGSGTGCANVVYNSCEFKGLVMSNFAENDQATGKFNDCIFGLNDLCGYLNCMGGVQTLTNCTFDYAGGATFGSGPVTKWNAINVYSENSFKSTVTLVGCTLINCTTFRNHGNSSLTVR